MSFLITTVVVAQEEGDTQVKTLLSKYNEIKGFGALDIKMTDVISKRAMIAGAYGGVIVNKQIMLGLGGYGFATNVDISSNATEDIDLEGGYGGLMLGLIIAPREIVHVTLPLFVGAGTFHRVDERFEFAQQITDVTLESSSFAVIEPGLQLEVNISKSVRLNFGASYRYIQGTSLSTIRDKDLSDFAGNVTLKVGKF